LMVPTEVQTTLRFSSVAVGQSHSCAVAQEGGVYCWGDNSRRQLGSLADARVMLPTRLGGSIP
jgi:alpha-tubulin suppressor-like RCC1 family protein